MTRFAHLTFACILIQLPKWISQSNVFDGKPGKGFEEDKIRVPLILVYSVCLATELAFKYLKQELILSSILGYTVSYFQVITLIVLPYPNWDSFTNWACKLMLPYFWSPIIAMLLPRMGDREFSLEVANYYFHQLLVLGTAIYLHAKLPEQHKTRFGLDMYVKATAWWSLLVCIWLGIGVVFGFNLNFCPKKGSSIATLQLYFHNSVSFAAMVAEFLAPFVYGKVLDRIFVRWFQ